MPRTTVCAVVSLSFSFAAFADTLMPLPPYWYTFEGSVRGYFFEAPTDFTITGLRVPDETNVNTQSVSVVRFLSGPPPFWPSGTNDFDELVLFYDYPSSEVLPVSISVSEGDLIGIYGQADTANSYGTPPGPFETQIAGFTTTLRRSGMQFVLNWQGMHDIWQEDHNPIGRIEMYYTTGPNLTGDLDGDCDVDLADLSALLANYGIVGGATYEDGDIDGDHDVDLADLSALLANYGATC